MYSSSAVVPFVGSAPEAAVIATTNQRDQDTPTFPSILMMISSCQPRRRRDRRRGDSICGLNQPARRTATVLRPAARERHSLDPAGTFVAVQAPPSPQGRESSRPGGPAGLERIQFLPRAWALGTALAVSVTGGRTSAERRGRPKKK